MNTNKTASTKAAMEAIALESINVLTPGSAPVALKLARIGGIGETVDGSVSWDRSRCSLSPGIVAETLVSALLCGCRALYNMKSFWEESGCAAWADQDRPRGAGGWDSAHGRTPLRQRFGSDVERRRRRVHIGTARRAGSRRRRFRGRQRARE
ncbi:MAG: hypothetical protein EOM12_16885, partial [Verrucomicrobiae bacterium]|nr:hypothetical protein [Verrucomicrobiae bacterium]